MMKYGMVKEAEATAIVVDMENGQFRLGTQDDIVLGQQVKLLLPNGEIVVTSPVQDFWANYQYPQFDVYTQHTKYIVGYYRHQ